MWTSNLNNTASITLKLLAQFLIFLCLFIYLDYVYLANMRPDMLAKENFLRTECFVMSKKLSTKGKFYRRFRADFLINYHANGVQYNRWVSGNGLDMTYTGNNASQEKLLSNFDNGKNYSCWYDPANAERVTLVQRSSWFSLQGFIFPALAALITVYYFFRNAWKLALLMRDKRQDKHHQTKIEGTTDRS